MTDFAALLANAQLVEKPFTRAGYTGPIDPNIVTAVQMILDNDKPLFIPVSSEEEFEGLAEQFVAQARKVEKTASATKVWADKDKTKLKALKVSIGDKRGRKAKEETAVAETPAPAEAK